MASRDFNPKTGKCRLFFRFGGKQLNKTIQVRDDDEARRACALIEETESCPGAWRLFPLCAACAEALADGARRKSSHHARERPLWTAPAPTNVAFSAVDH